jgi:hypothetical protein
VGTVKAAFDAIWKGPEGNNPGERVELTWEELVIPILSSLEGLTL